MKNISPLFESKAQRVIRKVTKPIAKYTKELPHSKLTHYTESFITKGAEGVSFSRRAIYKIGKR